MNAVLIEVRCRLTKDDPEWNNITSMLVETGYPGKSGSIIWKHIGWLYHEEDPATKTFHHAIWNKNLSHQILVFDFVPLYLTKNHEPEKTYRLRTIITRPDGKSQKIQSGLLHGAYQDQYIDVLPHYPGTK
jgi:hypothetical protein